MKEEKISKKAEVPNYEDIAFKRAMQYFGEVLISSLGIDFPVIRPVPTEIVHLEVSRMETDFNFLAEGPKILHFEFQSTNGGKKDLRRFRYYEVTLSEFYGMEVITYVVFTGNVKNPMVELREGINVFRIVPITLRNEDADAVFRTVRQTQAKGEQTTREELVKLLLTPLMGGRSPIRGRILEAFQVLQKEKREGDEEIGNMQAVLYAFASKFLKESEMKEIQEVIAMTPLGEMLMEKGMEKGLEKGIQQGEQRMAKLCSLLFQDHRQDELERVMSDGTFRETLYREYGI